MPYPRTPLSRCARRAALLGAVWGLAGCGGGGEPDGASADAMLSEPTTAAQSAAVSGAAIGQQVLVLLAQGVDMRAVATAQQLTLLGQFGQRPIYRLQALAGSPMATVVERLRGTPGVLMAEANQASETPEGKRNSFWAIGRTAADYQAQWAPATLRLAQAHGLSTGQGVRVAVLDTGIDPSHPAFTNRLARRSDGRLLGRDFVDGDDDPSERGSTADAGFGHGTHVAGLVALAAPGARLMPLRVLDARGQGNAWVLAEALAWAVDPDGRPDTDDGAHVVNLSLGSTQPTQLLELAVALANCTFTEDDDDDLDHPGFDADRARCARGHGAVVLAAAGNSGSADERVYPAAEEVKGSRAVTATTAQQGLASFANHGGWIKLAAPGDRLISAVPGGGWATWSGTSMATPLAAGTAALVLTQPPHDALPGATGLRRWRADDVLKRLEDRSKPVCGASVKQIDAAAAVSDTAAPPPVCS